MSEFDTDGMLARRARLMGPNVPTFYAKPVHLVKGAGVWLWDRDGKRYLDCYNNVPHVGHCHPRVVEAISRQAATLNTHTRYLHDNILDYIEKLTATLGHGLSQAIMVCSGSEANDIALRMAAAATGKLGIIATDATYHGNTSAVSALSTRRPPIGGYPAHVRLVPAPDSVRPVGGSLQGQSEAFARNVEIAIRELEESGHGFAAMMICPIFANEGIPAVPPGFFDRTEAAIRKAGGLLLVDEVQPGYGRLGDTFWGHEWLGIRPDVMTVGKPMANGHPSAAVLATTTIMASFREAFAYFNTFGGNPVSSAACLATLHVIEDEGLQDNARSTSLHMMERLAALKHPLLAEVRGRGMFCAVEFVLEDGLTPATRFTSELVDRMVERGFLMNGFGRGNASLKIRPPMPFSVEHCDLLLDALEQELAAMRPRDADARHG